MIAIPLKINNKLLCEIFAPTEVDGMSDDDKFAFSLANKMHPTDLMLTSETYSRNFERTADYEAENPLVVNRKSKPEFSWAYLRADYAQALLTYLGYNYDFKDASGVVQPRRDNPITITYTDFTGERTIEAYLGQTITGTLVVMQDVLWWVNFRIAFPEL